MHSVFSIKMLDFQDSSLWRKAFEKISGDHHSEASTRLMKALMDMRQRAGYLVALLQKDIPELTVHDLSHLAAT
jgi:hypothetical protein